MRTRYDVRLDKKSLSAVDRSIYIIDIAYAQPDMRTAILGRGRRAGSDVLTRALASSSVTVTFEIREADTVKRQNVLARVLAWAKNGGALTTSDRPGQRLYAVLDEPPVIGSALKWTQELRMTFAAYERPYWESEREETATLTGKDTAGALYVQGTAEYTQVSVEVTTVNTGGIDTLDLTAGDTTLSFRNLGLKPGKTLVIDYDAKGRIRMMIDGASVLHKRQGTSDDELRIPCGASANLIVHAGAKVTAVFKARGWYV